MIKWILANPSIKLLWWKQRSVSAIMAIFLSVPLHCKGKDTFLTAQLLYILDTTVHVLFLFSLQWLTCAQSVKNCCLLFQQVEFMECNAKAGYLWMWEMFKNHILKSTHWLICSVQVKGVCNKHQQAFKCQVGMFLRVAVTERPCSKMRIEVFFFSRLPLFPLIYLKEKCVYEYTLCVLRYKCTVQCVCLCVGGAAVRESWGEISFTTSMKRV